MIAQAPKTQTSAKCQRRNETVADALPHTLRAYTDGACRTSCGDGGFAVVFVRDRDVVREMSFGPVTSVTSNRMELLAALTAVGQFIQDDSLRDEDIMLEVVSDSTYVVNAVSKGWIDRWRDAHWLRDGEPMPHADLWQELDDALSVARSRTLIVTFTHVKGHAGDTFNERADKLAVARSRNECL